MQGYRLLNGNVYTGFATFTGTATTVDVSTGGVNRIRGAAILPVGTAAPASTAMFRLSQEPVADTFVGVEGGTVTLARTAESGGTLATQTVMYTFIGE